MPSKNLAAPSVAGDDWQPFFIVGCPRSGTTLLSVLVDLHSRVAATPETHFLTLFAPRFFGWKRRRPAAGMVDHLCRHELTRELGLSAGQLLERIAKDRISLPELFSASLREYAAQRGKSFCVEKTPAHVFYVDTLLEWYPQARIVCIVRDGRDVVHSLGQLSHLIHSPRGHAAIWREAAVMAAKWSSLFPGQFRIIRFEDLLTSPEKTLAMVMEHFGLSLEPAQLSPASGSSVISEWERTWKSKALQELDVSRVFAWRRQMPTAELNMLNSAMAGYLQKFGYEDPCAGAQWSFGQARAVASNALFAVLYDHRLIRYRRRARRFWRRFFPAPPTQI